MLFNKLIRIDLISFLAVVGIFFIPAGRFHDVWLGFATAVLIISIGSHIGHYITFKKFY